MGDIALVYHWGPRDMDTLTLTELIDWRHRAIKQWNQVHGSATKA
ncbi:GpE family phage tail protein [Halopseudomonas phragmitis]|uniref:Oxidoreductase n=1 Tax=Halopseudomonas phragmitis TaxID=1931241 RepID=A0A1V0B6P2_9GAMM|nr:GpE family phage tail protein [Halopseudomonas phragmitis]AQZ95454.1 oxidoreductase [Halopseudomonas phragmitis]